MNVGSVVERDLLACDLCADLSLFASLLPGLDQHDLFIIMATPRSYCLLVVPVTSNASSGFWSVSMI